MNSTFWAVVVLFPPFLAVVLLAFFCFQLVRLRSGRKTKLKDHVGDFLGGFSILFPRMHAPEELLVFRKMIWCGAFLICYVVILAAVTY